MNGSKQNCSEYDRDDPGDCDWNTPVNWYCILAQIVEEANRDAVKEKEEELIEKARSKQECCICYDVLEGFSVATNEDRKKCHKRACFLPCMHANVCITCAEKRWRGGPKECPICCQPLTERPKVIYLWGGRWTWRSCDDLTSVLNNMMYNSLGFWTSSGMGVAPWPARIKSLCTLVTLNSWKTWMLANACLPRAAQRPH